MSRYRRIIYLPLMQHLFDLKGKTAFITGASSGLGEQCAYTLSKAGARVILIGRNLNKLEAVASKLNNAMAVARDVSDKDAVNKALNELDESGERIDICINSAGIATLTPIFEEEDKGNFEQIIQTNLMGTWYITKAVALHMKRHNIHGSIINISSVNGANKLREGLASYAASKAAVIQLTKALVGELSLYKIRINCIAPGLFHTPLTHYKLSSEEAQKSMEKLIPLGFVAQPTDLEGVILLLASNAASAYITGSCITIDGGVSWGG